MTLAFTGSTSAAKWLTKSSSGSQAKTLAVDDQVGQRRGRRSLFEQGTDRLALVEPERRDVDQARHVRRVRAQGGDDLAAVRVAGDQGRALLAGQHLAQPGDVIR